MEEKESDGEEAALLPGLPDVVVLFHVISRLPWYVRPVLRALSKAWRLWIDTFTKHPDIRFKSRQHLLPLLRSHFLVCTYDYRTFIDEACHGPCREQRSGYRCIRSKDHGYYICGQWRELPPLRNYFCDADFGVTLMVTDGMVYARATYQQASFILKMDLAAGDWTWKKLPTPADFNYAAVPFNRKIYVPNVSVTGEEGKMLLVHDMTTEECGLVETWNHNNLRVLRNKIPESSGGLYEEELYSFVKHMASSESGPKLEILKYDACYDSWMTKVMLPLPEFIYSCWDIKLANRDCFEPVPDGGINIVWNDHETSVLSWFNSSLHETWVDFDYNPHLGRKHLDDLQFIHGCLYAVFREHVDDENGLKEENEHVGAEDREDEIELILVRRTIMKGKMVVETNNVKWEEVHYVGCFPDSYFLLDYEFMA